LRQAPSRADEMAGVAVRIALEIVLMLGLRLPEIAGGRNFGGRLAGPKPGRIDVGDGVAGHALLLGAGIENRRAITHADIVALAVARRRIVDLEEELEQLPVAQEPRVEDDLDRFGVGAVVAISGVPDVAAAVADPGRDDAGHFADQILHAPKAASGKHGALGLLGHFGSPCSVDRPYVGAVAAAF